MWTDEQIKDHKIAAELLIKIKDFAFNYIQNNKTVLEYDIQQFILKKFREFNLVTDKDPPIVAFNRNSATPEFYPKIHSERLKPNTFILIDIWAKLNKKNAPFADITWVAFLGDKMPSHIEHVFNVVIKARNEALEYIKAQISRDIIPTGKDVDSIVRKVIIDEGFEKNILHETGHSLGIDEDHGKKPNWIYKKNQSPLIKNIGYTIEPGIYLENEFGVRSEMDFYIDKRNKLVLTTPIQKNIIKI